MDTGSSPDWITAQIVANIKHYTYGLIVSWETSSENIPATKKMAEYHDVSFIRSECIFRHVVHCRQITKKYSEVWYYFSSEMGRDVFENWCENNFTSAMLFRTSSAPPLSQLSSS